MQIPQEANVVISGSYIVFACMNGYRNVGGSLNVTCDANSSWSRFPNCILSTQTSTVSYNRGVPCTYSPSLLRITNGFIRSSNGLMLPTVTQALSRAFIEYACRPPYILMGTSRITCTNGAWSSQPVCMGTS